MLVIPEIMADVEHVEVVVAHHECATLTLGHPERLGDVVAGYSTDVDPTTPGGEVDVLMNQGV